MANKINTIIVPGRLSGQIIGCTGNGPYLEQEIKDVICQERGTVGNKDIWQHSQAIVIGQSVYDIPYLLKSLQLSEQLKFRCRYMSQEDFLNIYRYGGSINYTPNDPRIKNHRGLSLVSSWSNGSAFTIPTYRVNWHILPPGEYPFSRIIGHFRQLQANDRTIKIDEERLEKIYSLEPSEIYVGDDEFKKYIVFYFASLHKAVLECPIIGNAIYVIHGEWEVLSQYTKAELLEYFSDDVSRIIHNGDWFGSLKRILGIKSN